MSYICSYCNKEFKNQSSLSKHKITAKYCLKIQNGNVEDVGFKCEYCDKILISNQNLKLHLTKCNIKEYKTIIDEKNKEIDELKRKLDENMNKHKIIKCDSAIRNIEYEELRDEMQALVLKNRDLEIELKLKNDLLSSQSLKIKKKGTFKYFFKNMFKK
jgi:predicted nuclease with TOPRIM domain